MPQRIEDLCSFPQFSNDFVEETLANGRFEGAAEALESSAHVFVFGGCSEERIDGPPCANATVIQVQVRSVEGKTLVVSIGPVVENLLGDSAHGGETGTSLGHGVPDGSDPRQPSRPSAQPCS